MPVAYFFDEPAQCEAVPDELDDLLPFLETAECRVLSEAFARIDDELLRRRIISLVEALGGVSRPRINAAESKDAVLAPGLAGSVVNG